MSARLHLIDRVNNPIGADPHVGLIKAAVAEYGSLGITEDNTVVKHIVPAEDRRYPHQACLTTITDGLPTLIHRFFYDREDLGTLMQGFTWTPEELAQVQTMTNSADIVRLLEIRFNRNFPATEIWQEATFLDVTSDDPDQPALLIRALDSSGWYRGTKLISLTATPAP